MKRRDFIKKLGIGVAVAPLVPVIAKSVEPIYHTQVPAGHEITMQGAHEILEMMGNRIPDYDGNGHWERRVITSNFELKEEFKRKIEGQLLFGT